MLLHIFNKVFYAERNGRYHLNELQNQVDVKSLLVPLTDAVAYPRAMVIVSCHALVTRLAMLSSQRLFQMADCAVFGLYKQHNIFVTLFFFVIVFSCLVYSIHFDCLFCILLFGIDLLGVYLILFKVYLLQIKRRRGNDWSI